MRPHLLDPTASFDPETPAPPWAADLIADLGLDLVVTAMAAEDALIAAVSQALVLAPAPALETIHHRQQVLADCLRTPEVIRELYVTLGRLLADIRRVHGSFMRGPGPVLDRACKMLDLALPALRGIRDQIVAHSGKWQSPGMATLVHDLATELDDPFFDQATAHLALLSLPQGTIVRARLGGGLRAVGLALVEPHADDRRWYARIFGQHPDELTYRLPERDEAGARALSELRERGLAAVADAVSQAAEHVQDFCRALYTELGFYLGCLNLADRLSAAGVPVCLPDVQPDVETSVFAVTDLRDVALLLAGEPQVVGNDLDITDARLVVITGANRGGKSTFLRSLGQAQLLADAGAVVAAEHLTLARAGRTLTHFRREEDRGLTAGKLEDELIRMSALMDHLRPGDLVLANEPFASTNEREGSEIARQVFEPLLDAGVRIAVVTHLADLATGWASDPPASATFLRADPSSTARTLFRLRPGAPLDTSHGVELGDQILPLTRIPATPARDESPWPSSGHVV